MAELGPELRAELGREDWQLLFDRVVRIAEAQSNWLRWRGSKEGVMPDGNEAKSIANEAIGELFAGNCRLGMPYTREELEKEFERLVHQQVDRLHRRKENVVLRNIPDLAPLPANEDGEELSMLELMAASGPRADEETSENEQSGLLAKFREEARAYLRPDKEAQAVFECICDEVTKRSKIAARLGLDGLQVKNAHKRMKRMLKSYAMNGGKDLCEQILGKGRNGNC